jgi:hypothetical protein
VSRHVAAAAAALLVVVGGCCAEALAAASGPTGNQAAIKLFQKSVAALAAYQGISFTGRGALYTIIPEPGGTYKGVPQPNFDEFNENVGGVGVPAGYHAATDQLLIIQHNGLVTEEVDTLSAPGLPMVRQWQGANDDADGEVLTSNPCALTYTAHAHWAVVGAGFYGASAGFASYRFAALSKTAAGDLVTATFPVAGGTATQVAAINPSNGLLEDLTFDVHGGSGNGYAVSESDFKYIRDQATELPPGNLHLCNVK